MRNYGKTKLLPVAMSPEVMAELFSAMAEPHRLQLLQHLAEHGEQCVCNLSPILDRSDATTSRHLAQLRKAGFLNVRREGTWAHYSLAPDALRQLAAQLYQIADLAETNHPSKGSCSCPN